MDFRTDTFHVIEFEDGIQVVPDNWIQRDINECWYPNYKTDEDVNKAIKRRQIPQDDWLSWPIKRLFSISDSYDDARKKLKKAEMHSDINTDTDDKTRRKIRAKKSVHIESDSTDSESCLPPFPKVPKIHTSKYKR
ncbi:PREDICTED: uncharacterized protein LOC105456902 [Wasmannia auropunctata]|uniref:uncharacterized protein LOC105456902 n=1 Tax=Wasmannia auropunctata TaxID=64793 RepID=UPI0005F02343|nr:PREDICTED: uncharacterized protein LOC105456902 [Wasmannia auropunctata]